MQLKSSQANLMQIKYFICVVYFVNVFRKMKSETLKLNLHLSEFSVDDKWIDCTIHYTQFYVVNLRASV